MASKKNPEAAPSEAIVPAAAPLATTAPAGQLATTVNEYGDDSRAGLKELTANEKSIPFLNLMQTNNPEVEQQTIKGVKAGDFVNSVSKEIIPGDVGLIIQPVFVQRIFVQWKDRDKHPGGGIVARHLFSSAEVQEAIDRNGGSHISTKDKPLKIGEDFLVDTRYLYCNVVSEDLTEVIGYFVLAGAKSKVKPVQDFYSMIDQLRGGPPMWCVLARLTSFQDKQKSTGKLFKNVAFRPAVEGRSYLETLIKGNLNPAQTPIERALYARGKEFAKSIDSGRMQADFDTEAMEVEESEAAAEKRHF